MMIWRYHWPRQLFQTLLNLLYLDLLDLVKHLCGINQCHMLVSYAIGVTSEDAC